MILEGRYWHSWAMAETLYILHRGVQHRLDFVCNTWDCPYPPVIKGLGGKQREVAPLRAPVKVVAAASCRLPQGGGVTTPGAQEEAVEAVALPDLQVRPCSSPRFSPSSPSNNSGASFPILNTPLLETPGAQASWREPGWCNTQWRNVPWYRFQISDRNKLTANTYW